MDTTMFIDTLKIVVSCYVNVVSGEDVPVVRPSPSTEENFD